MLDPAFILSPEEEEGKEAEAMLETSWAVLG